MNINTYGTPIGHMSENKKYKCFCSNCNGNFIKTTSSKTPVTSYGVIVYYYDKTIKDYKFLIIRRKDTLGYVDFLRGKYTLVNTSHITNLINEMTNDEKNNILNESFDILWKKMWNNKYETIDYAVKKKYDSTRYSITNRLNLKNLVKNSPTNWHEPEWGFPKGRKNFNEKDFTAALREFTEETGINCNSISVVQNINPIDEIFIGSNYKAYKHRYYLAKLTDINTPLFNFQKSEVSKQGFFTKDEIISKFRPYNREKIEVLNQVYSIVSNYSIE